MGAWKNATPSTVTLTRVHDDDVYPDGELGQLVADDDLEDDDAEIDEQGQNAHTLSIRRADGEEVVTIFSPSEEWSVYLEPGGGIQNAFVGTPSDPTVWVNAVDQQVVRDEDGTYVIRIN
jgi:hypothetical protein